jgi:hypothetical protein
MTNVVHSHRLRIVVSCGLGDTKSPSPHHLSEKHMPCAKKRAISNRGERRVFSGFVSSSSSLRFISCIVFLGFCCSADVPQLCDIPRASTQFNVWDRDGKCNIGCRGSCPYEEKGYRICFTQHRSKAEGNHMQDKPCMPLRLRGGLEVQWRPAPLQKTKEWLEATTFDGSPVNTRFVSTWDAIGCSNETLIHMAAELGDATAIVRLVEAGVDVNTANTYGQTPLHKAAMMGHQSLWCLSTLIRCGADVLKTDDGNATALDEARDARDRVGGPEEAITLLERAEAIAMARREGISLDVEQDNGPEDLSAGGDPGLQAFKSAEESLLPPSLHEYLVMDAKARAEKAQAEKQKAGGAEAAAMQREEEDGAQAETHRKRKPNKKRYKNVKERWAKYKAKKKEKRQQGSSNA